MAGRARRRSDYFKLAQKSLRDHHRDTQFIVDGTADGIGRSGRSELAASDFAALQRLRFSHASPAFKDGGDDDARRHILPTSKQQR